MSPEEMAVQIGVAGYTAWSNCLVGNQAPATKAYFDRAGSPRVGDLVVETSSLWDRMRGGREPEVCVGVLVAHEIETVAYETDPDDPYDEPGTYEEDAWYVKVLARPDDIPPFRWTNASFVAIPRNLQERMEFRGSA